jgi:mannitol-1-phosphate 5-dehydrogenase
MKSIKHKMVMGNKSILIFGAGKIGRSFIGQLFGLSGYEVIFSDIDPQIVNEINKQKSYSVVIKGEKEETLIVPNVRAVLGLEQEKIVKEILQTSILAVSVGKDALEKVIPLIAEGLKLRYQSDQKLQLNIIIAENMRSAGEFIHKRLSAYLPKEYPLNQLVGLVETSIGKMVPIMKEADIENDPLMIFAEPYNSLIVDKKAFKGAIPIVDGLSPKDNIAAWVDRKAFIHNLGHATVAYFGFYKHPKLTYIYEVLEDPEVYGFAKDVMQQAASILQSVYINDFTKEDLDKHIDDLLNRFRNKALMDTIYRVGQDRPRKLSENDRFMGIIRLAISRGMKYNKILQAMVYSLFFEATDENGKLSGQELYFNRIKSLGVEKLLENICGVRLSKDKHLVLGFMKYYKNIKKEVTSQ